MRTDKLHVRRQWRQRVSLRGKGGFWGGGGTNNNNNKKKRLSGLPTLMSHLQIKQGYALCNLCVDNKRDFVSRLTRYTPCGLKDHVSQGNSDGLGFGGHPMCKICRQLHKHLNREHYKCHMCNKAGKPNVFFMDCTCLERHFDRDHFLCCNPQCLAARFLVFENEINLRRHQACMHGDTSSNTKIGLEFQIRRDGNKNNAMQDCHRQGIPTREDIGYGPNSEAFVPEALPDDNWQSFARDGGRGGGRGWGRGGGRPTSRR